MATKAKTTKTKTTTTKTTKKPAPTKKARNNTGLICGICIAIVAVIAVVILVVTLVANKGIDDSYFVSDNTKYVLSMDMDSDDVDSTDESAKYLPKKIHQVYTYDGDTITGLKYYYEYDNADSAKSALSYIKEQDEEGTTNAETNGKYIVVTLDEESYKDLTASDVKNQIDFYEALKNGDYDLDDTDIETEDIENDAEIED